MEGQPVVRLNPEEEMAFESAACRKVPLAEDDILFLS